MAIWINTALGLEYYSTFLDHLKLYRHGLTKYDSYDGDIEEKN